MKIIYLFVFVFSISPTYSLDNDWVSENNEISCKEYLREDFIRKIDKLKNITEIHNGKLNVKVTEVEVSCNIAFLSEHKLQFFRLGWDINEKELLILSKRTVSPSDEFISKTTLTKCKIVSLNKTKRLYGTNLFVKYNGKVIKESPHKCKYTPSFYINKSHEGTTREYMGLNINEFYVEYSTKKWVRGYDPLSNKINVLANLVDASVSQFRDIDNKLKIILEKEKILANSFNINKNISTKLNNKLEVIYSKIHSSLKNMYILNDIGNILYTSRHNKNWFTNEFRLSDAEDGYFLSSVGKYSQQLNFVENTIEKYGIDSKTSTKALNEFYSKLF